MTHPHEAHIEAIERIIAERIAQALDEAMEAIRTEFRGKPVPSGVDAIGRAERAVRRVKVRRGQ